MNKRQFWIDQIESLWLEKNIIWLKGVRRSGKTTVCKSLKNVEYFDCELPRVRLLLEDPEVFFQNTQSNRIILDEIHRLKNPSEVLKIAADHFSNLKIIATGSSTLGAHKKFKDSLTDRKRELWLTPINFKDFKAFDHLELEDRLFKGGFPAVCNQSKFDENYFSDWIDSYWAKDIQEQFSIRKRDSFIKFFELLCLQSGGMFEAKSFSSPCAVSHNTINSFLDVLELTCIAIKLRPFFKNKSKEIISAPKVYFFDTGFISYFSGAQKMIPEQSGNFFEHFVLNEFISQLKVSEIYYWRDKAQHEVDFIIKKRGKSPVAVEVKYSYKNFDVKNIKRFRKIHTEGLNYVVSQDVVKPFTKKYDETEVRFINVSNLDQI
ncbi:MAG: ATP-binding protein [Bdellovibrionaceae bacterium]|nr:ATP-binding protein [Pseudobdellovibrionaceae bacterium]